MIIIESYSVAVLMCVVTMLCWGSWANTQKMATKKWPFQLFYWDYSLGILFLSLILAFTMGSSGEEGRGFIEDLVQSDWNSRGSAFLGGVVFNIANLLVVLAINLAGMAVAFPIGIGLALIVGVFVNYIQKPDGNPYILALGVALVVLAIIFNALAYRKHNRGKNEATTKVIVIALVGGLLMGFFYLLVARSMGDFAKLKELMESGKPFEDPTKGLLTPYTASVIFALGILVSNFLWNSIFMYRPVMGEKAKYVDYFRMGNVRLHLIGILGGMIWSLGMSFSIIAAREAGPAISYGLGQGATLIAALWGVFIWKEFGKAEGLKGMLTAMFLFFISGLGLIILARMM